jgi:hypothetical protein
MIFSIPFTLEYYLVLVFNLKKKFLIFTCFILPMCSSYNSTNVIEVFINIDMFCNFILCSIKDYAQILYIMLVMVCHKLLCCTFVLCMIKGVRLKFLLCIFHSPLPVC